MRLLSTVLIIVAIPIAGMALLLGAAMAVDPDRVREGLIPLVLITALAGACVAVALRLRRETAAVQEWDEWEG